MYSREVRITTNVSNNNAAALVQRCMRYDSEIVLEQATRRINAKSIMGVLSLGLKEGSSLMITAKGDDEQAAVADIVRLIENKFMV